MDDRQQVLAEQAKVLFPNITPERQQEIMEACRRVIRDLFCRDMRRMIDENTHKEVK
jgi:hypothetical protein